MKKNNKKNKNKKKKKEKNWKNKFKKKLFIYDKNKIQFFGLKIAFLINLAKYIY